jgi:serine/threonine protein kinase
MGEVYKARDTRLDRTVAVKVLPASLASDRIFRERFDREARTISSLDHPNICVLHDVGREGGVDYLVMQFLDGETLAERLTRGPLPIAQALDYGAQMAAALDRAHRSGIVHRDLKPGNVMLVRAGGSPGTAAKLLDFGLAKSPVLHAPPAAAATMTSPLTGQGTIVGTLQYMAPEQIEGRDVDARTDIFALGAILYEMVTGRRAFEATSQAGVMAAILEKDPPPFASVQPLAPASLDRIVQRSLAKDPDGRWQSAADLAAALKLVGSDSGAMIPPARVVRGKSAYAIAVSVGAAALSVAALTFVLFRTPRPASHAPLVRSLLIAPPMEFAVPELSPDGTAIVWSDVSGHNRNAIWLQPLDSEAARPLAGTEGASFAF